MADLLSEFGDEGLQPDTVATESLAPPVRALQPETAPLADTQITTPSVNRLQLFNEPGQTSPLTATAPVPHTLRALSSSQRYLAENTRTGIPLETTDPGKNLGYLFYPELRAVLARAGNTKDRQAILAQHYGATNVRQDKAGEDFIVTVPDKEGKPRDVKLRDMEQMTVGDLAAIATSAVGIAGAVAGVASGRALPLGIGKVKGFLGFTRDLVTGAAGQEAADAAVRGGIRAATGQEINPGELAADAAKNLLPDVAIGYGIGATAKTIRGTGNFLQAPFSFSRQPMHEAGLQAAKDLERETGITLLYDPGEATGFPLFAMGRQYIRSHPAAATLQNEFDALQSSRIAAFKDWLFSGAGSDEEAGRNLIARLQTIRDSAENVVIRAQKEVGDKAQRAINSMLPGTPELRPTVTGEQARQAILARGESITAEKNAKFARVQELPEAREPIFPTEGVEQTMRDIKARLPDREVITETVSPLVDEFGRAIPATTTSRELIKEFVPPDVAKFVNTKFDEKMPLQKMIEMRNLLWDRYIPEGEANPGISTRYLGEVSHAITESIDQTVAKLPSGELKTRLGEANTFLQTALRSARH